MTDTAELEKRVESVFNRVDFLLLEQQHIGRENAYQNCVANSLKKYQLMYPRWSTNLKSSYQDLQHIIDFDCNYKNDSSLPEVQILINNRKRTQKEYDDFMIYDKSY